MCRRFPSDQPQDPDTGPLCGPFRSTSATLHAGGTRSSSRMQLTRSVRLRPDGPVGNCARSAMCCFSFSPVKPITTAEGGVVTTNDDRAGRPTAEFPEPWNRSSCRNMGGWYYTIDEIGTTTDSPMCRPLLAKSQIDKLNRVHRAAETRSPIGIDKHWPTRRLISAPPCSAGGVRSRVPHLSGPQVPEPPRRLRPKAAQVRGVDTSTLRADPSSPRQF